MENKRLEKEINGGPSASGASGIKTDYDQATGNRKIGNVDDGDFCKICMESIIDCVLLDCGHMCSCIKCGKQLAECPICRQNVVRVIRVFKS